MKPASICIFGEVLFDHFPDGSRVLGGAPFNVAWHLQAFGLQPRVISRVGNDDEGESVLDSMRGWGMDTRYIQRDEQRPTGRVSVTIEDNEPAYDIVTDSAWDAIEPQPGQLPAGALFYHGTLATRAPASRATQQALASQAAGGTIFLDVNLRPPWWERDSVMAMIAACDWIKLNQDELDTLVPGDDPPDTRARALLTGHGIQGLILTMGAAGARAYSADGSVRTVTPVVDSAPVDTVGAGDAFTAVVITGICLDWPLDLALERAQHFASLLVGRRGAIVDDKAFYAPLLEAWRLPGADT